MQLFGGKLIFFEKKFAKSEIKPTFAPANTIGAIAQLVEQRTENPCVPSSILGGTTEVESKKMVKKQL